MLAVFLAAIASFISNLGVNLQKLHHIRTRHSPDNPANSTNGRHSPSSSSSSAHGTPATAPATHPSLTTRAPSTSPTLRPDGGADGGDGGGVVEAGGSHYSSSLLWRCGLLLIILGSLFDVVALAYGPQSLIAPLGSLTLVSNILCANLLLHERVSRYDIAATALIVLGSSIAIGWGKKNEETYTLDMLFSFYTQSTFILYATIVILFSIHCYTQIHKFEKLEAEEGKASPLYLKHRSQHRFYYPALSGTIGAQSVLFAKCSVELLIDTFSGNANSKNMFTEWPSYVVISCMFGSIFYQIRYLNEGLRRFSSTYSIPVFQAFWILVSVISGLIYYKEYKGLDAFSTIMFGLGVSVTVGGVVMLSRRDTEDAHHSSGGHVKVEGEETLVDVGGVQRGGGGGLVLLGDESEDDDLDLGDQFSDSDSDSDGEGEVEMSVLQVDKGLASVMAASSASSSSGGGSGGGMVADGMAGKDSSSTAASNGINGHHTNGVEEKKQFGDTQDEVTIHIKPQSNNERGQDKERLIPSRQSPRMQPVASVRTSSGGRQK